MPRHVTLALLLFVIVSIVANAQETNDPPKEGDTEKQIVALIEEQNKLADDYNAILKNIKKHEDLIALDRTIADAKGRLAKAEAANEDLAAARAAEVEARDAVKKAVEEKLREDGAGGQLLEQLEELQAKRTDHLWQIELAQFQMNHELSPIHRALAADAELAAAKAKLDAAAIEERTEAKAAYDKLRAAKLDEIVEAQRHLATIEDSTAAAQRMRESIVAIEERLAPIRKKIERIESKRIEDAREKAAAALNSDAIVALRKEVNDGVTQYNEPITKLVAENDQAVKLKEEYDAVVAKIKALRTAP